MIGRIAALVSSLILAACASGHILRESPRSLDEIRAAINAIAGSPREMSENRRTFYSNYFSRRKEAFFDPTKSRERLYAKFTILGDRRPYDIQVEVHVEERSGNEYDDVGVDEEFSEQIALELQRELSKSREDRNVIDDFRAF